MWHEKQIFIALIWSVLIFIGYNVITAPPVYSDSKQDLQKELCEDYKAKWTDGECKFSKESEETDDQGDYEDDLFEMGLYDDYYNRNTDKEKVKNEDWRNTIEPDLQINSPVAIEGEDVDKKLADYNKEVNESPDEEDIAEYNEEGDENYEADFEEENESGDDDEQEEEESDDDESEDDNSDSESEQNED